MLLSVREACSQVTMLQKPAPTTGEPPRSAGSRESCGGRPDGEWDQLLRVPDIGVGTWFVLTHTWFIIFWIVLLWALEVFWSGVRWEGNIWFPFYDFRNAVLWVEGHTSPSYTMACYVVDLGINLENSQDIWYFKKLRGCEPCFTMFCSIMNTMR